MLPTLFSGVFRYLSFRIAAAAVVAFLLAVALVPLIARYGRRRRFVDREGKSDCGKLNELHAKKKDTPVLGGLAILGASLASIALFARVLEPHVALLVLSLVGLGALGLVDDVVKTFGRKKTSGITPRQKLAGQVGLGLALGAALVVWQEGLPGLPRADAAELEADAWDATGPEQVAPLPPAARRAPELAEVTTIYPPFLKRVAFPLGGVLFTLFVALVLTGSSNAVNLTDGLDGLAGGCVTLAWLVYVVLAYVAGRADWCAYLALPHVPGAGELAVACSALAGATAGFLWFNVHPAEIFMGDAGSLPLGGALGLVAIMTKHELLLVLVGGVFVAEALSVMLQVAAFKLTGRRALRCAPLHHHFEIGGWAETKVVARFHLVAAVLAVAALATLKVR